MAIKLTSLKCPECGASLSIEVERTSFFCSYCGAKIVATNENEFTYRHVDEAKVKQAETERTVRLKELELEERDVRNTMKSTVLAYVIAFLVCTVGVILLIIHQDAGVIVSLIGMTIALYVSVEKRREKHSAEDKKKTKRGYIEITDYIANFKNKDYRVIEEGLHTLGFTNIKTINLKDLTPNSKTKRGAVEDITVNGEYLDCDYYETNARIVITFHDFE